LNQQTVQNINQDDNATVAGTGLVLTADMVYRNGDNLETNIMIEPPNLIQPTETNENIIVDILQVNEQEANLEAVTTIVPNLLHYDINEHEGMM
jgi:hypothetical protein